MLYEHNWLFSYDLVIHITMRYYLIHNSTFHVWVGDWEVVVVISRTFELIEADVNDGVTLPCTTGRNVLGSTECGGQQGKY